MVAVEFILLMGIAMVLSEMIKGIGFVSSKFIPIVFSALCFILCMAYAGGVALIHGLFISVMGIGLFSSFKNVGQGFKMLLSKTTHETQ